jgi:hypothetical protein
MPESLAREIGLLRTLAAHLEQRPLPFEVMTQELLRREGRAARHRARDFSLFRVERLRPPPDCFGRHVKDAARNGVQLGRRIGVRGHFKMQRHGRANTLRKLIYVAGHFRGDMNEPPLHGVVVLRDRRSHAPIRTNNDL